MRGERGATEHCVTRANFWAIARMNVDGIRQVRDSSKYVSFVKGSFPFDCLPDGFGDSLRQVSVDPSNAMFVDVQDAYPRLH